MPSFHDFTLQALGGGELPLEQFKGKTVLAVNVASKCGLTPQYTKLEALYREYKDKDFVILGIPCNQFMGQEPGTDEEIQSFCSTRYDVTFPMSGKIEVNGENKDPLYAHLAGNEDIQWNFEKFLIGKDGATIKRFSPKVEPDAEDLISTLEANL